MSAVNQPEGLVRGADGVLYDVSPVTCEPVPEIHGDTLMAGAKGTGLGPSESAVGEVFSGELDATGDTHVVSAATAFAIWVLLSALGWVVILATIVSITKLL